MFGKSNKEEKEPEIDTDPGDDFVFEDNTEVTGGDHQKKVEQLKTKLKEAEEKAAQYLDNWQRDKAEFINVRKRDEASQEQFVKFANEKLILDILPMMDNFQVALDHIKATNTTEALAEFRKGIQQIRNQLMSALEKNGVKKFSPLGEDFDPSHAQAIATVPGEHNKVIEVVQSGYELNGRVIRPAMVKVGE